MSCTTASRRPKMRLTSVDLPTFGRPTIATTGAGPGSSGSASSELTTSSRFRRSRCRPESPHCPASLLDQVHQMGDHFRSACRWCRRLPRPKPLAAARLPASNPDGRGGVRRQYTVVVVSHTRGDVLVVATPGAGIGRRGQENLHRHVGWTTRPDVTPSTTTLPGPSASCRCRATSRVERQEPMIRPTRVGDLVPRISLETSLRKVTADAFGSYSPTNAPGAIESTASGLSDRPRRRSAASVTIRFMAPVSGSARSTPRQSLATRLPVPAGPSWQPLRRSEFDARYTPVATAFVPLVPLTIPPLCKVARSRTAQRPDVPALLPSDTEPMSYAPAPLREADRASIRRTMRLPSSCTSAVLTFYRNGIHHREIVDRAMPLQSTPRRAVLPTHAETFPVTVAR